jgi:tetratricopeptide (TPR) repeat protein
MPLDPYSPCPGGTGKKIKFCCSEMVGDLEQIDQLTAGEQYAAALAEVDRLLQRTPGRACLLAHRTRLQLATRKFPEAVAGAAEFLAAFPDNPVALGQAAITEGLAGKVQEAAALFDKAREVAGKEPPADLVRTAQTLVQVGAQTGHPGFAQGLVEWLADAGQGTDEEQQALAAIIGSAGVPPALRAKMPFEPPPAESPYRFEFEAALKHAGEWHLSKALGLLRSLKGVAGESPELFTDIAILCELLARPFEASEAWLTVARLEAATAADDAVEATGRAIALETEADPQRSPLVVMTTLTAPLAATGGEAGGGLDLLEDAIRHDGHCEPAPFDRSAWVSRGAAPPHSVWRIYADPDAAGQQRLLASLLVFGRQTDREPEAVLQGFEPDVAEAKPLVERFVGGSFAAAADVDRGRLPATTPTNWLLNTQYRVNPTDLPKASPTADEPSPLDVLLVRQRSASRARFLDAWPDTALPELLGKTPREAVAAGKDAARRVEALVSEGEATGRPADVSATWTEVRSRLGLPVPTPIASAQPLQEVEPMRWHRVSLEGLDLDQLRMLFLTSLDAGFELSATRAAEALVARPDATPEDRWEAYGLLEDRAETSLAKLEIIGKLRDIARTLKANDGMLDVAELRIRLSRADEAGIMRLLNHLQREHGRDQKVIGALAGVLSEAGVDLAALAAQSGAAPGPLPGRPAAAGLGGQAAPEAGRIWTPGGEQAGPPGEKKTIWTPG